MLSPAVPSQAVLLTSTAAVSAANRLRFLRAEVAGGRRGESCDCDSGPAASRPPSASAGSRAHNGGNKAEISSLSEMGSPGAALVLASASASERMAA